MNHDEFVGNVQHRAQLSSRGDAETLTRVTLETLSQRLQPQSAAHLAAQLPTELGRHLRAAERFEHLSLEEFYSRISARLNVDVPKTMFQVRGVIDTLHDAISPGAMDKLRKQMPVEFQPLLLSLAAHP